MIACGDVEEGHLVQICECGGVRQMGRPHGYTSVLAYQGACADGQLDRACPKCGIRIGDHLINMRWDGTPMPMSCPKTEGA